MPGRRIKRTRSGEFAVRFTPEERELLRNLPGQIRQLLDSEPDDPSLRRLFPPAYTDEPEYESEYQELMGRELRDGHVAALALLEETVDAERLTAEQAGTWMRALNEMRLVLGTRLDVTEDMTAPEPTDTRFPAFSLYQWLSWLEEQLVEALADAL